MEPARPSEVSPGAGAPETSAARDGLTGDDRRRSTIVELKGGRVFGLREYGAPDGRPVIALHGTPGSRFKFASAHASASRLGLRLISLDRWGYGLSSHRPGARLSDFATDVGELADKLGLARFRVVAISGGAPFAAAIAATRPERVIALALVSPVGPIAGVVPRPDLSVFHFLCFRVLPFVPGVIPLAFNMFRVGLRVAPAAALAVATSRSAVDRLTIGDPEVREHLAKTFGEGLEPGTMGVKTDMDLFARPWGVDLLRADMPARIWIGTVDRNVPLDAARWLARTLPRCELTELDGAGHLWVSRNSSEVMTWLAAAG